MTMKPILLFTALLLSQCAYGPDWSPDIQSAAASFGGPVFSADGRMMAPGSGSGNRQTMFTP
jgi:hypothetical protein